MPLGYVKGNTYCQNWEYDRYAALPIFKLLCDLARKDNLSLHFSYSNITRAYDCEVRRIHYFKESRNPYWIGCANRGGDTPLEALCNALRVATKRTPLLEVLCLEAECVLLDMAVEKARAFEQKLDKALDQLRELIEKVYDRFTLCETCHGNGTVADGLDEAACSVECPSCEGTGYGAYLHSDTLFERMNLVQKTVWIDITPTAEAVQLVMNPPQPTFYGDGKPLPADPGEDDDL